MKISTRKVAGSQAALGALVNKEMPIGLAVKIKKVLGECDVVVETLREAHNRNIKELCDDSNAEQIKVTDEDKLVELNARHEKLLDEEVDIEIKKVPLKELEKAEISIAPVVLHQLEWFIEFPE